MSKQSLAVALALLLGVQLALVAYFGGWFEGKPPAPTPPVEEKPEPALPSAAEQRKLLPVFFADLGAALRNRDNPTIEALYDRERWVDEVVAVVRRDKGAVPPGFRKRLVQSPDQQSFSYARRAVAVLDSFRPRQTRRFAGPG